MITCPECGAQNDDGAKFCERCGQGIAGAAARPSAPAAIPPLAPGTELKGFRIVELIGKTSHENRYRAERKTAAGVVERFQLREQLGPAPDDTDAPQDIASDDVHHAQTDVAPPAEDPNGPRAKTAELKLKPPSATEPTTDLHGASGGLSIAAAETAPQQAAEPHPSVEPISAKNGSADVATVTPDGEVTLTEAIPPDAPAESQAELPAVQIDAPAE